jgi:hypothetical protein
MRSVDDDQTRQVRVIYTLARVDEDEAALKYNCSVCVAEQAMLKIRLPQLTPCTGRFHCRNVVEIKLLKVDGEMAFSDFSISSALCILWKVSSHCMA